ncbi:hypothetical protein VLL09_04760 [Dehalococcoides mccartyi]|uniref:Uncharacterized protein n=1 Tax=Dehalococcoides mccartyi TaxID=61435 RepID=A0AB38Z7Y9_9CHLR|nr:hypothetical protein [Dehalococcoides mccartyi]WRO06704.1 hypothetical protein VLL09_04760 [Dehalococcoides mccartyi]
MSTRSEALNRILKPEHRQAGFSLDEDEDFLYLKRGDKVVAVWNANKATADIAVAEANRRMTEVREQEG